MRRLPRALFAVILAMTATIAWATPAQAFGGETLGCRISPGTVFTWNPTCDNNTKPASTYNVGFLVQNTSGSGYSYTWVISGPYISVAAGCTSSSADCAVYVHGGSSEKEIDATVTVTQSGQSQTLYSTAFINGWCYSPPELC